MTSSQLPPLPCEDILHVQSQTMPSIDGNGYWIDFVHRNNANLSDQETTGKRSFFIETISTLQNAAHYNNFTGCRAG